MRPLIIAEWANCVGQYLPSGAVHTVRTLTDQLPRLLDELALALRGDLGHERDAGGGGARERRTPAPAVVPLEQVIAEYAALRSVIFETLEASGPIAPNERDLINAFIDYQIQAAAKSAALDRRRNARDDTGAAREHPPQQGDARESAGFLHVTLDSLKDGVVACDAEGQPTFFNRVALEMHGLQSPPVGAAASTDSYALYHADGATRMVREEMPLYRTLRDGAVTGMELVVTSHADGTRRRVICNGRVLHDRHGQKIGAAITMHELTAERITVAESNNSRERAIVLENERRMRERLLSMFNKAPVVIAVVRGPDLVFEYVNELYLALRGRQDQTLIGASLPQVLPDTPPEAIATFREVLRTGERKVARGLSMPLDYYGIGTITEKFWNVVYEPLVDEAGNVEGVMLCASDVTDQITESRAYKHMLSELEHEREMREAFVAGLAHDLRNPMSAAKYSALILSRQNPEQGLLQQLANRVVVNLDRMEDMIRNLLDANRVSAGLPLPLQLQPCDLKQIVQETLDGMAAAHRFELHAPEQLRGDCDPGALRRVIENLGANAVKYGDPAMPITVTLTQAGGYIDIEVHNWGPPIPVKDQLTLFEPFRRTESAHSSDAKGWGIGLTIMKGVAEAHGGMVGVESSAEQGTTFRVRWPLSGGRAVKSSA